MASDGKARKEDGHIRRIFSKPQLIIEDLFMTATNESGHGRVCILAVIVRPRLDIQATDGNTLDTLDTLRAAYLQYLRVIN